MKYFNKKTLLICCSVLVVVLLFSTIFIGSPNDNAQEKSKSEITQETLPRSYIIEGVPVIAQEVLKAGCETYACTMLLQYLGYDIDEYAFSNAYLITSPVFLGFNDELYGPDMDSAYAGDVYSGFGINAPAMAKSMNNYLSSAGKNQKAYPFEGVDIDKFCEEYILNDIPVMIWATTNMQEPYVAKTWIIDYVDENSKAEKGDIEQWMQHEHCLVLIGYDEQNYYFADSVAGEISVFEKEVVKDRYEKIGSQAIVVK